MKWFNCTKMKVLLVVFTALTIFGGGTVKADFTMSDPVNLGPVINDTYDMQEGDLSHDGLEFYFAIWGRPDGSGSADIWVSRRETLDSPWQELVNLGPNVNSSGMEVEPSISGNGLELYFSSWDDWTLRVCTRPSKDAPWSIPEKIGQPVCSDEPAMEEGSEDAWQPDISADGLSLYFSSTRVGGFGGTDIWVVTRATTDDPWSEPVNLGSNINSSINDSSPCISTDGLTLVFTRTHPSGIWATTRKSVDDDWGPAIQLDISSGHGAALSPDGSTLYLEAYSSWGGYGNGDYWQMNFIPIVDFNSDEIVDLDDLLIMIDNWGTDDSLCDIAPVPLGDGIVDEADLEVLMSYWGREILPDELTAFYRLDETEGDIASDSIGGNDGTIYGEPLWQPEAGYINGALELDGIDDYISTPLVLQTSGGLFSVFVWVKDGAPGQVIFSQENRSDWLAADAADGSLTTGLKFLGKPDQALDSQIVVTDGNWHRVGLVWDGTNRILYVDDVQVASDTYPAGQFFGDFYIGAGKKLEADSFFSGLIDDVRIYNQAVTP